MPKVFLRTLSKFEHYEEFQIYQLLFSPSLMTTFYWLVLVCPYLLIADEASFYTLDTDYNHIALNGYVMITTGVYSSLLLSSYLFSFAIVSNTHSTQIRKSFLFTPPLDKLLTHFIYIIYFLFLTEQVVCQHVSYDTIIRLGSNPTHLWGRVSGKQIFTLL